MAASVRIEDEAFSDERYDDLAAAAGLADGDHARGKMARLWRQCTLEHRYVLPVATVLRILGDRGVDALVAARLGEVVDDGIRVKGTKGRIEWLKKLRKNGRFGKKGGRPKKNPDGFQDKPLRVSESDENKTPPAPAPAPAPAPSDSDPDLTYSRVVAPPMVPPVGYDPDRPGAKHQLAESIYARVSTLRVALASELGLPDQLPFPIPSPSARPQGIRDLLDRVAEEGASAPSACDIVVVNLAGQAREAKSIEWLSTKAFTAGGWRHAREWFPGQRAPPRSSKDQRSPHVGRVEPQEASAYGDGDQEL